MAHVNVPSFPGNRHYPRATASFRVSMPTRVHKIMHEVARSKRINITEMLGMRGYLYRYTRREAMWRVRTEVKYGGKPASYDLIGKWFGCHGVTVLVACAWIERISPPAQLAGPSQPIKAAA